ncbi:putative E3 ubiquitin protein ligase [Fulvia fulva]|uniref:HECT-type E3 ubiquitin transferase n=1 Tax=Passalora fulva TaxID=5499 RepID=A0A9Q8P8S8_PASFU|nr:putative E3 ubiquitin protein ligase [Fulvia fulva]UJO17550.1 putative E3 ubiquitin protein ligase [Fulvia fulva]WPV29596.1 putative E3 ubiquitin protein ligase [Fulvia fulva]
MYQTFTGSGRRPRQVNLSGRPTNPFANSTTAPGGSGAQQAVASAQQDRIARQQQRDRIQASSRIQKVWRGHHTRRKTFKTWRQVWDDVEHNAHTAYPTSEASLRQLRRLMLFFSPKAEPSDVKRLTWYGTRQITTSETVPCDGGPWPRAYAKLQAACVAALRARSKPDADTDREVLGILAYAARQTPFTAREAIAYYEALTSTPRLPAEPLQGALLAPLSSRAAYKGLVILLGRPLDPELLQLLKTAADPQVLSEAIASLRDRTTSTRERLWLLGNLIFLTGQSPSNMAFTAAVGRLLGGLADDVDFESPAIDVDNATFDHDILSNMNTGLVLNTFLRQQVLTLLDKHKIQNLLSTTQPASNGMQVGGHTGAENAQILASYALTLLRCFPRRADDIRMWLHLGPTNSDTASPTGYLWNAAKSSATFNDIRSSSRGIVSLLQTTFPSQQQRDDWTVILVFLEMFSFDLKIMDDEEFMGSSPHAKKNSAVPVADVASLVTFLKNLGFTLVYDAAELNSTAPVRDLSALQPRRFTSASSSATDLADAKPMTVARLPGLTTEYLKGVITALLRALYERDSRRHFLPRDHWLMTERFDMSNFTRDVVAEEQSRKEVESLDAEDKDDESDEEDLTLSNGQSLRSGSGYASVLRRQEARERAQKKASRQRYLEAVAPRLEILQNMPFFIPFHVRVQIFREFVELDQLKRRDGFLDPDMWRQSMMFQPQMNVPLRRDALERHHAKIKRTQEFQDAYEQFYDLGDALKEPIQITFVDKWDMPEAGIDGGGVTKEFLTSVITQAFDQHADDAHTHFFIENDQHLLYPNPTSFEDARIRLQEMGLKKDSADAREHMRELQKQYEFLGRIIGKCLYEGILIDVNFAPFFLKKWALSGGSNSATNESHYRPTVNDLRELDESLYRGLLAVKHAENAEAFDLTFVVDTEVGPEGRKEIIEVDLMPPNGANTLVTNENRLTYINRMAAYKLQAQSKYQTNAFLRGLGDIIQPSWLSMFNQLELQTLIGGSGAGIDVQDLRKNTLYGGTYQIGSDGQEHPSIKLFWKVMQTMQDEDRRKVLKFVTSTPRGPLLGFSHLNPRFSIRDSGQDENRFPTTSTCVNLLKLPMYKSEKVLREKLLAAVNSGAGFDLS